MVNADTKFEVYVCPLYLDMKVSTKVNNPNSAIAEKSARLHVCETFAFEL